MQTKLFLLGLGLAYNLLSSPALGQIIPDRSLPHNSLVTNQGNMTIINGGTRRGSNLFQSFSQFSVPEANTALFNNAPNIQNIITRVTGNSVSNIDGTLQDNGTANLWFINPNGIVFGQNAQLNIGGSFFATTANSINFADGFKFNADGSQSSTLLTISIPVGLLFNGNPGSISQQGTGQGISQLITIYNPYNVNPYSGGLSVSAGKSISLVGGDVNLQGATLTAPEGVINIGSVDAGNVSLHAIPQGWELSYANALSFGNINLTQRTLINTIGNGGGDINFQGNNIFLSGGSIVLLENTGDANSIGNINVNSNTLNLKTTGVFESESDTNFLTGSPVSNSFTAFLTEGLGNGTTGNINIKVQELNLEGGSSLYSRLFDNSSGGNININANSVKLKGYFAPIPISPTVIVIINNGNGESGDIKISTGQLLLQDGGVITTTAYDHGNGGNIAINASDITVNNPDIPKDSINTSIVGSFISSNTYNSTGNAGNITLNTKNLYLQDQGNISSQTEDNSAAGNITINSSSIQIVDDGYISASAFNAPLIFQEIYNSPPITSGYPGVIQINTNNLYLANSEITITNQGIGHIGGTVNINANSTVLNKSSIIATTQYGVGGDIILNIQNLQLLNSSNITATANNNGNGGNITINTNTLVGLDGSNISANAFTGNGGNIQINTKGLFFSPDSLITASSNEGINGTVSVNTPEINLYVQKPPFQYVNLPKTKPICSSEPSPNELVTVGKGGIPQNPNFPLTGGLGWEDLTPIAHLQKHRQNVNLIQEAQGWETNHDGTVSFSVQTENPTLYGSLQNPTCQFSLSKY